MDLINQNLSKIITICKKHNVESIYLFGSIMTDKFSQTSDIDFLVNLNNADLFNYFDNFLDLKTQLEILLKRKIDLIEEKTLNNPYLIKSINRNRKLLWMKK